MNQNEKDENRELFKQLRERIKQLRMDQLFDEPSAYEDDPEE